MTETLIKPTKGPVVPATENTDPTDNLIKNCSVVRVSISWFSSSAKVDDENAKTMSDTIGADRAGLALSKRLMASRHPAVKACNESRQSLMNYVRSMTVPKIVLTTVGSEEAVRKDAGVRLIQKKDMAAFDQRVKYLSGILKTSVEHLQEKLPEVMAEDRKRLGDQLFRESDYPKDVRKLVSIDVRYENADVDLDWKQIAPEIYKREAAAAKAERMEVVRNWAVEFGEQLMNYTRQVIEQLGNRVRVNPETTSAFAHLRNAELVFLHTHETDPATVPVGRVQPEVRYSKPGDKASTVELLSHLDVAEYDNTFKPFETSEKKKIYGSTIENLKIQLETFLNTAEMFGPYKELLEKSVHKVQSMLQGADKGMDVEKIADQLRSGTYFRTTMQAAMQEVSKNLQDAVTTVQKVRRKIRSDVLVED